jgi:hypothetical protein
MTSCAYRLGGGGGGVRRSGAKHPDRTLSRRSGAAATLILQCGRDALAHDVALPIGCISGPQATAPYKSLHDADLEATGFNLHDVPQSLNHHKSMTDSDLGGAISKLPAPLNATSLHVRGQIDRNCDDPPRTHRRPLRSHGHAYPHPLCLCWRGICWRSQRSSR